MVNATTTVSTQSSITDLNDASDNTELTGPLTQEETRAILTPFAFKIDPALFGIRLALPRKRLFALAIDLLFITLLSETSGEFLALAIAIVLYRLGKKTTHAVPKKSKRKRKKLLRFLAVFIVFVILLDVLPPLISSLNSQYDSSEINEGNTQDITFSLEETLVLSASVIQIIAEMQNSDCQQLACWKKDLSPMVTHLVSSNATMAEKVEDDDLKDIFSSVSEATNLVKTEQQALTDQLIATYKAALVPAILSSTVMAIDIAEKTTNQQVNTESVLTDNVASLVKAGQSIAEQKKEKPVYSMVKWLKALIEDLGLGFGWAALYFTVFTALWQGQTPGKRMFGIRVLQLDGTPLSLWDSFGRYGGYGAGIATGLLGFMQIYWDANRQAIHDKISATVVIDVNSR